MEQGNFLPFSSVVASLLLYKPRVTSIEIINFISLLSQENIFISDEVEDNEMDILMMCVDCHNYDYFKIKDNMTYDSYLFKGVTVKEFLYSKSSLIILDFIKKCGYFKETGPSVCSNVTIVNKKIKRKFLARIFNLM